MWVETAAFEKSIDGHIETECPVQWYGELDVVFVAADHYNRGMMPHAGGWADQPAKLMRFVTIANGERVRQNGNE